MPSAVSARQRPRPVQGALESRDRRFADSLLAKDHVEQSAQATRRASRRPEIFRPDVFKVIYRSDAQADITTEPLAHIPFVIENARPEKARLVCPELHAREHFQCTLFAHARSLQGFFDHVIQFVRYSHLLTSYWPQGPPP